MRPTLILLALGLFTLNAHAAPNAPWGSAPVIDKEYSKQKVVYDVTTSNVAGLTSVLDRASHISLLNGADPFDNKIVIVLHGGAIPFFGIKNFARYKDLMARAQSLSVGGVIEFRMCRLSAQAQGFKPADIHGFVSMVPMADAEIVELQAKGHAYMR